MRLHTSAGLLVVGCWASTLAAASAEFFISPSGNGFRPIDLSTVGPRK